MIDTIRRLVDADSVESVWAVLAAEMDRCGFDRLIYGFTRFRTANGLGNRRDMLVLSNHDPDYVERFFGAELYAVAPMVAWASRNVGAMSWRWLSENADNLTECEKKVIEFNRVHGVVAGYTISFPDCSTRRKAAIALTARRGLDQCDVDRIWARHGRDIELVNRVAHLKIASLPVPESQHRLSKRQREVLEWVTDGKTASDIAGILGVSIPTVEKHLRLARQALGVETTAQAVMKASVQHQIFVVGR